MARAPALSPLARLGAENGEQLLAQVGARVRCLRETRGIPRRVLSDISGISQRYLAQLEAGEGNISIALLQRVANALGHRVEWFLMPDQGEAREALEMAERIRAASPEVRAEVLRLLGDGGGAADRAARVCLIGLRGAGKSTLGRAVGRALDLPFVELNAEVEALGGMPVAEIIALYGAEGYRALEGQALERVIHRHDRLILAVGGGIVAEDGTFGQLLARFHTVWLRTTPQEHMARVLAQGDTRPMADNPGAMDQLRRILTAREPRYRKADAELDTSGDTADRSAQRLAALIRAKGFLGPVEPPA